MESALNAIVMVNPEGKIILVNAHTEKLFGYGRDELIGQALEMLVPERFRTRHPEYRSGFFANPQVRSMGVGRDLFGRRKDGSEFPVEIGLNPIKTDEGLVVLSAIVDITERKKAEERFRQAVESAPNGMVMINPEGTIVLVNAQTERLFGYDRAELLGHSVELLVPERFRSKHPDNRAGFFANPQVRSMGVGRDLFGRRKDGSEFPVEIGLNPIKTDDGLLVLSAIVDITERKNAEDALRESEARYRYLFEHNLAGVMLTREDGVILDANDAAAQIFGVNTRQDLIGRQMPEFYFEPSERAAKVQAVVKAGSMASMEFRYRRARRLPRLGAGEHQPGSCQLIGAGLPRHIVRHHRTQTGRGSTASAECRIGTRSPPAWRDESRTEGADARKRGVRL